MSNTLNESLQNHPICKVQREITKEKILRRFDEYITHENFNKYHYSLRVFATREQLLYGDFDIIDELIDFFSKNEELFFKQLQAFKKDLSHAFFSLVRPGSSWGIENKLSLSEPNDIIQFERVWHPEYQRYCEHIYNHLMKIPLGILGAQNNKNYNSQHLANRVKTLQKTKFNKLAKGYEAQIRNAISHGDAEFSFLKIIYHDRRSDLELSASSFSKKFDSLVDTCNSIAIATIISLCNQIQNSKYNLSQLPLAFKYLYLNGYTYHKGYEIKSLVVSKTKDQETQLNIHAENESTSRDSHILESLHSAWALQKLPGINYDRYGISIDCGKKVSSNLFLDGTKLQKSISDNLSYQDSKGIVTVNMLWHDSSVFEKKFYTFSTAFKTIWKQEKEKVLESLEDVGFLSHKYEIKELENKSVRNMRRVEAYTYLNLNLRSSEFNLTDIVNHIVKKLRRKWFYSYGISKRSWFKRRPSYVWVKLFTKNHRTRRMKVSSWSNERFLCKAEWISRSYREKPIFIKNEDFITNNIRYKLNPNVFDIESLLEDNS